MRQASQSPKKVEGGEHMHWEWRDKSSVWLLLG
jgi:hypothetical protein